MTVAISLGYGCPKLTNCSDFRQRNSIEGISTVDIIEVDKGHVEALMALGVKVFSVMDIAKTGIGGHRKVKRWEM